MVCGYNPTLKELEDIPWLAERDPPTLDKGLLQPMILLRYLLSQARLDEECIVFLLWPVGIK